jgi:hypothetical protein
MRKSYALIAIVMTMLLLASGLPAVGQAGGPAGQAATAPPPPGQKPVRLDRAQIARWDGFLDSHPDIARQLNKHPRLADNPKYLSAHPELREFLANHPNIHRALQEHPKAVMNHVHRYERTEKGEHPHPMRHGRR